MTFCTKELKEMSTKIKNSGPSLQDSLMHLGTAFKIITENARKYYAFDASQVTKETIDQIAVSFVAISSAVQKFNSMWIDSKWSGPDAIVESKKLDDRLDIKLIKTGKLDFEQMSRILTRLNRADDALLPLNQMVFYISDFIRLCNEKNYDEPKRSAELLLNSVLNRPLVHIRMEIERHKNQIDRCSLYFQSDLKSKAIRIALISLVISTVSIGLTVFNTLMNTLSILGN